MYLVKTQDIRQPSTGNKLDNKVMEYIEKNKINQK